MWVKCSIPLLIILMQFIFLGCNHKDLCYSHPHDKTMKIVFHWQIDSIPEIESMFTAFFPFESDYKNNHRYGDLPTEGGYIKYLSPGKYRVVSFNNSDRVQSRNSDNFETLELYTRTAIPFEGLSFRISDSNLPKAPESENEEMIISPDLLFGSVMPLIEIFDDGKVNIFDENGELQSVIEEVDGMLELPVKTFSLTEKYDFKILNIENQDNIYQFSVTLSGMKGTYRFSTGMCNEKPYTLILEGEKSGDDMIQGEFYSFGTCHKSDYNRVMVYVITRDGKKLSYGSGMKSTSDKFDVTQQLLQKGEDGIYHIVIDGLSIPEFEGVEVTGGNGFNANVGEWITEEIDIVI